MIDGHACSTEQLARLRGRAPKSGVSGGELSHPVAPPKDGSSPSAERTHLVEVDLPGFGHSQRSDSLLYPQAMGEFIIAAADAFGLEHPHVVAPGIGTAAALFAAARHPGRLRSLVAGSGAAAVPLQLGGMVKDIIEAPDLDGFRRADPRQLVNAGSWSCAAGREPARPRCWITWRSARSAAASRG